MAPPFISTPYFWRWLVVIISVVVVLGIALLVVIPSIDCPIEGVSWNAYQGDRNWIGQCR